MNTSIFVQSFLPLFAEFLVKSAAILLAAGLVSRAWRRASAAQRHGVWLAAFSALLLLPATRLISPRWNLAPSRTAPTVHVRVMNETAGALEPHARVAVSSAPGAVAKPAPQPVDWNAAMLGLWLAVGAVLLARRGLGGVRLHFLRRTSATAGDCLRATVRRIAAESGVSRPFAFRVSATCRVPLTWGALRPVLMLPAEAATWPPDRLSAVLRHECAHIRRGDYAVRLLADVVRAFYWPNPLVWFASRALRTAQEQACDDLVLSAGTSPTGYATLLCEVARGFSAPAAAVAMAQPSTLETRVRAIVDATRNRRPLGWRAAAIGALSVMFTLLVSAAAQLRAGEQSPSNSPSKEPAPAIAPGEEKSDDANTRIISGKGRRVTYDAKTGDVVITPGATKVAMPPPVPVEPENTPQIMIEAKFVEITPGRADSDALLSALGIDPKLEGKPFAGVRVLADPSSQALVKKLNKMKGVEILSAPRVTTKPGQRASIETGNELRYATEWEQGKAPGTWKPTAFESRSCGCMLEAVPTIQADGTLALELVPQIVKLQGFIDKDTGQPVPDAKDAPEAEGPRRQPVLSTRKVTTSVTVKPGDIVLVDFQDKPGSVSPFTHKVSQGRAVVFIKASLVIPNSEKAPAPALPAVPQIEVQAQFVDLKPELADAGALLSSLGIVPQPEPKSTGIRLLTETSFDSLTKALGARKAADFLSFPKVTTKSGQRAVIEIIRERRYATAWKKGATHGAWKPTAFETRNVGTTLEVEPVIQADGTIALQAIPRVVDFLGFFNLDTGKPMPPGTDDSAPEGPRLKAVFSEFMLDGKIALKSGETAVLEPLKQTDDVKLLADRVRKVQPVVFVTAAIIQPAAVPGGR